MCRAGQCDGQLRRISKMQQTQECCTTRNTKNKCNRNTLQGKNAAITEIKQKQKLTNPWNKAKEKCCKFQIHCKLTTEQKFTRSLEGLDLLLFYNIITDYGQVFKKRGKLSSSSSSSPSSPLHGFLLRPSDRVPLVVNFCFVVQWIILLASHLN